MLSLASFINYDRKSDATISIVNLIWRQCYRH
jgi:hypothetical protein